MAMNPRLMRPVTKTPPAPSFDPASITNLSLWLDASDAATLFDETVGGSPVAASGSVARWEDKSGNGVHFTQDTANNRPTVVASALAGKSGLLFDDTNDSLASSSAVVVNPDFTLFVVHKATSVPVADAYQRVIEFGSNDGLAVVHDGSNQYAIQYSNGDPNTGGTPAALASGAALVVGYSDSDSPRNVSLSVGNVSNSFSISGTPNTPLTVYLNQYGGGGYHIGQEMYEVLYYERLLSVEERASVTAYLTDKWQLT